MNYTLLQFLFFIEVLIFTCVIFMHLSKKRMSLVLLYTAQSAITTFLLFLSLKDFSISLLMVALLIFIVKVIVAPYFFSRLIEKKQLYFSTSSYLNVPLTLLVLIILTAIAHSHFSKSLVFFSASNENPLLLAISTILISLFLIINQRSALSQMIGILSLENGIVSFAALAGLEQTPGLQLGVTFDILVWIIIASVFTSMVYKKFGSLDVTVMKHLKE